MPNRQRIHLAVLSILIAVCATLVLMGSLGELTLVRAAPSATTRYVATTGTDTGTGATACITPTAPCQTIFHATWEADDGDTVLVTGGVYTVPDGISNVIYLIEKSLTIRGGYSVDFAVWDPDMYITTLDAEGQGPVIWLQGNMTPTLEALWLTNGTGGANPGGGIHSFDAHPVISGCHIYSNTAGGGGGIYIINGDNARLTGNKIFANTATGLSCGGGVMIAESDNVILSGNRIYSNTTTSGDGGGVCISSSPGAANVTLLGNEIWNNYGSGGGGVLIANITNATLEGNVIRDNSAINGGGISIHSGTTARLTNNIIADNTIVGVFGAGIAVNGSVSSMQHTTIASNDGDFQYRGVYVTGGATAWMTNTILVDHHTGIEVTNGSTATLSYTLWGTGTWGNNYDIDGSGTIYSGTLATNWWELPGFLDPASGDYHIGSGSGALERALDTGLDYDIDGEARPFCAGPDLGADENGCCARVDTSLYPSVQDGVRAADPGDLIEVAGTCRGVDSHSAVAYITESVTIRGGYAGDFGAWDPDTYPTTLDAQGQGRVVYVDWVGGGHITPTLEILRLTNGSTTGVGGGVYVEGSSSYMVHPVITGCLIYDNASNTGGGIGLYYTSDSRLTGNTISDNTANGGPPIGGGVFLHHATAATLVNNMLVENQVGGGGYGSGISLTGSDARMLHTTIARNSGGNGQGVYVAADSAVALTNTILVSHTVGIQAGGSATLVATLWGEGVWLNKTPWSGSVSTGTLNYWGDPDFDDPDGGNYHVGAESAAIGRGVPTFVTRDIDGELRRGSPTLGADEMFISIYLPLVLRNH